MSTIKWFSLTCKEFTAFKFLTGDLFFLSWARKVCAMLCKGIYAQRRPIIWKLIYEFLSTGKWGNEYHSF